MATTTPATTHRSKDSQAQASEGFAVTIACSEDEDTTADCAMDVYLKGGGHAAIGNGLSLNGVTIASYR